ncbi:acyl-CoA dehydrogenase [Luteococcus sediminum]
MDTLRPVWCGDEWMLPGLRRDLGRLGEAGTPVSRGLVLAHQHRHLAQGLEDGLWPYLQLLATLGSSDLTLARAAEPHLDAVAILHQAGIRPADINAGDGATWGVYAANAPGMGLTASQRGDGSWRLDGRKPWCSLARQVTHALVTAQGPDGGQLFALPLHQQGVQADLADWHPRGLVEIETATITLDDATAHPVGAPGFYLDRPGFAWGGVGVAAVWFGGAAAVAGQLLAAARRREPDQIALMHLGACDRALSSALAVLRQVADELATDRAAAEGRAALLAARARAVVAEAAEEVLRQVGHGSGPAPLAMDPEHTARVADLTLYIRQHHAERDLAAIGCQLLDVRSHGDADG